VVESCRSTDDLWPAWRQIVGADNVLGADAAQSRYGADCSAAHPRTLCGAITPASREQIPAILRVAQQHGVALYPISTGHNWGYGTAVPVADGTVILDLSQLRLITDFDERLGIVTVEPGVTQQMLSNFLQARAADFLVPVTGAGPTCSILGNALERGYGITPQTDHFGAVLALEAVLPDGTPYCSPLLEAAPHGVGRLFKWGVGPHLDAMFSQSGFGVVTRMTIALARRPEAVRAVLFGIEQPDQLPETVDRIRGFLQAHGGSVGAVNLMNQRRMLAMSAPYPRDQVADGIIAPEILARMGRDYKIMPWTGLATFYGSDRVSRIVTRELRATLRGVASRVVVLSPGRLALLIRLASLIPGARGKKLRAMVETVRRGYDLVRGYPNETALPLVYWRCDVARPDAALDPSRDGCGLIWYPPLVPLLGEDVERYVTFVTTTMTAHGFEPLITLTTISERVADSSVPILFDRHSPAECARARQCYLDLLEGGQELGFFPYRLGVDAMTWLEHKIPNTMATVGRLKRTLDPGAILSPGRYAPS
jgi:4-cresol dehydrogenase (hydroxylating) flavoprotein subunit